MIDGVPALSTWLFYAGNVLLIAAYLVICALMLRKTGLTGRGQMNATLTTITVLFFITCAMLHLELAFHAYSRTPLIQVSYGDNGTSTGVDLHFTALILVKVVLVVAFGYITSRRSRDEDGRGVVPFSPAPAPQLLGGEIVVGLEHVEHGTVREMRVERVTFGEVSRAEAVQDVEAAQEVKDGPT